MKRIRVKNKGKGLWSRVMGMKRMRVKNKGKGL